MRLWNEEPHTPRPATQRAYETVGYVIKGKAKLHMGGQVIVLEEGNSWVVPQGESHFYEMLEHFEAVEATHPPAEIHDRDRSE